MRERNLTALSALAVFILFFAILVGVIFVVLIESGIIPLSSQPVSVTGFSCTSSGTSVNLQKSVPYDVNVTSVVISTKGSSSVIKDNYTVDSRYFTIFLSYRCLSADSVVGISVYYSAYASLDNIQQNGNNFFSKLISDTRV